MPDDPKAGTPEPTPQDASSGGTVANGPEDGSTDSGDEWRKKYEESERVRLANLDKVERANQVLEAMARQPRNPSPTSGERPNGFQVTAAHVEMYREAAASTDPATAAWGAGSLTALDLADRANRKLEVVSELLKLPDAERDAVRLKLERGEAQTVAEAKAQVTSAKVPTLEQENAALRKRLEGYEQKPPEKGTHVRAAPGGSSEEVAALTTSQLAALYREGKAGVAKAREFERKLERKEARLTEG